MCSSDLDFITGATVSGRAMRAGLFDAARIVLRARAPKKAVTEPTLDLESFALRSWEELVAQGSIVRKRLTNREAAALLDRAGGPGVEPEVAFGPDPDGTYIEVYVGLATPTAVGRNLFGGRDWDQYTARMPAGTNEIVVASNGPYEFLGIKFYQNGRNFDRLRIAQGERIHEFSRAQFQRLGSRGGPGIRSHDVAAMYYMPPETKFDPLAPWNLEILIHGTGPRGPVTAAFPIAYQIPATHVLMPEVEQPPAWLDAWREQRTDILILGGALAVLTLILAFQAQLTRFRGAHRWVRNGFLAFVVVWLGWIAGAQL